MNEELKFIFEIKSSNRSAALSYEMSDQFFMNLESLRTKLIEKTEMLDKSIQSFDEKSGTSFDFAIYLIELKKFRDFFGTVCIYFDELIDCLTGNKHMSKKLQIFMQFIINYSTKDAKRKNFFEMLDNLCIRSAEYVDTVSKINFDNQNNTKIDLTALFNPLDFVTKILKDKIQRLIKIKNEKNGNQSESKLDIDPKPKNDAQFLLEVIFFLYHKHL